jgi:ComF family protein
MKWWTAILDLLFPSRCVFCRRLTQENALICPRCREKLPYTESMAGQEFPGLEGCWSALYYVDSVRSSLLRYKFGGLSLYAQAYGEILAKCIDENKISCDSITWVPLSRKRLRKRGYDQAMLLARETAERLNVPCGPTLRKLRNNPPNSSTGSAEKRRHNVKNVYAALEGTEIAGKRLLLIDDIVTTGATLCECARVLRSAGAIAVLGASLARRKD